MSESTLLRQLKQLTGLTPLQYMQEIRLNEARQLLENRTYKSVAQVAEKVGYSDARSFSRAFQAALFLKLCARASKPASTLIFSFPG